MEKPLVTPDIDKVKKNVGKRIKDIRLEHDLKGKDVAELFGCDASRISRYEKGDDMPPSTFLINFAKTFGTSLDYIVFGERPKYIGKMNDLLDKYSNKECDVFLGLWDFISQNYILRK